MHKSFESERAAQEHAVEEFESEHRVMSTAQRPAWRDFTAEFAALRAGIDRAARQADDERALFNYGHLPL